ncbi:3',5'-cyclic adenosine monophosphate phosphodiesterase CpdA [bioreactor metagenome]|uniref:3',5'-cyclic adenosine monophosphate phosphodiesterase CpdA n=1 Tax=bioreactor metagenome TaxID=1076179 RepID=A0A645DYU8_9ZZZZ
MTAWAILLIAAGLGILTVQGVVFAMLRNDSAPLLPPAGLTLQPERKAFTVAVFSDFAGQIDSVEKIGGDISRNDVAFTLCLGDIVKKRTALDFLHVTGEIRECMPCPVYAAPGNWDRNDVTGWETYRAYFGQDYYFFGYGDTLFVALNTADGNLPEEQRTFLAQTLKRERPHFRRCVIFCHIPPKDPRPEEEHAATPDFSAIFEDIIRPYRIDLILCGHIHCFTESEMAETRLVTTPSAGQEIREPDNPMFGYLLLDFAADGAIGIRRVDVTPDTGREEMEYFFTVELCRIGWFVGAVAAMIAGIALLPRGGRKRAKPPESGNQ